MFVFLFVAETSLFLLFLPQFFYRQSGPYHLDIGELHFQGFPFWFFRNTPPIRSPTPFVSDYPQSLPQHPPPLFSVFFPTVALRVFVDLPQGTTHFDASV